MHNGGVISLTNLAVTEGDVTLLPATSIAVPRGAALIVRGANGAGKSTLLRVLAGLTKPSSGQASIGGAAIAAKNATFRARVAAMIGLPPFAPDLTMIDHLALVAVTWWADRKVAMSKARDILGDLGLDALGQRFAHELSSGQLQLFALAIALVRPADVVLLDEPEQRLDPDRLARVIAVLKERQRTGTTLVIATHSPALMEAFAGTELVLEAA